MVKTLILFELREKGTIISHITFADKKPKKYGM
jgi:hypothetical protein